MKKCLSISIGLLLTASVLQAQTTIAKWTFETSGPSITGTAPSFTGIAPEVGSGTASGVHASSAAVWSSPAGNGSVESFSVNNWAPGDYWQFEVSTVGYTGVGISWDQTSSSTGPRDFRLDYSLNLGSSWTTVTTYSPLVNGAPNAPWSSGTYNPVYTLSPSLAGAVDNQASVWFRLIDVSTIAENGGTVAATGTDRVDNFAVVVPEPSTLSLLGGFVLLAWTTVRRRK